MLTRKAQFFSIIYLLAAIAYGLYSIATSTGLGGYIADWQLKYFDSAYDIVTIPILMVLLCAPGFAILMLAAKIAPSLVGRPRQQNTPGPAPIESGQPKQIPIKYAVLALLGIGAIISSVLFVKQTRDKHEKVYDMVLNGNPGLPPSRARFIQLTGVPSSVFRAVYKETDRAQHTWMYIYVAVTQEGWTIGDSVRYFALYEPTEGRRSPPGVFTARNPVKFAGRIGGTLPVAIRRKFESAGLNIDPSYVVIHYGDLPDAEPDFPFWLPAAAIACFIAAIAVFVAVLWGLSLIAGRKGKAVAAR
jgi:hypothetical protein